MFQNAFNSAIEKLPPNLQLEVINLQFKDMIKGKYQDDLIAFYKFLPSNKYAQLKSHAHELQYLAAQISVKRIFKDEIRKICKSHL